MKTERNATVIDIMKLYLIDLIEADFKRAAAENRQNNNKINLKEP